MNGTDINQRSQRSVGEGALCVKRRGCRTCIDRLYQEGAARIRMPAGTGEALEAVMINTGGGMTGGDRFHWSFAAADNCDLVLTTQASEKIYRSAGGAAHVRVDLTIGRAARIAWLPQESILFDRSRLHREIMVDMAADARCILIESLVFGRAAMGEHVRHCRLRDRWTVRVDGSPVHAEAVRLGDDAAASLEAAAVADGAAAVATILLVGADAPGRLAEVRALMREAGEPACGASAWTVAGTGKLLARIVARDGYRLRKLVAPLVVLLNGEAGLPKIWAS